MSNRAFRQGSTAEATFHARMFGTQGAVTAEHYLAADAASDALKQGGNAVDAVAAGVLLESLVDPQMFTLGGEAPFIIRMASTGVPVVINGNTQAPATATPEEYSRRGFAMVPNSGILAAGVPACLGAVVTALRLFGTLSFREVAQPAMHYARVGFPAHVGLLEQEGYGLEDCAEHFRSEWPSSAALYLPAESVPQPGDIIRNGAYADLLELLSRAEDQAIGDRAAKLEAVYRAFYNGEPASIIERHSRLLDGLIARADLESFETRAEDPAWMQFGDACLYKCGAWNQGPVVLQTLAMLSPEQLRRMGHNTPAYVHQVVEAMKLAFADREQYYGDPRVADIPLRELLSREYAAARCALIDPDRANPDMRPGDPRRGRAELPTEEKLGGRSWGTGTVHVNAIDRYGNMVACTPSGGWIRSSPVVAELGFPLGTRLMTFHLSPRSHPNVLAPSKRPRTTISPSLATRAGKPWMVFGSMGGDQQDQWQLQFFLNRTVFDMPLPAAIEAPKFSSEHFPASFGSSDRCANRLRIERALAESLRNELSARGHDIDTAPDWSEGFLLAIERHDTAAVLEACCDPRGAKSQIFAPAARVF